MVYKTKHHCNSRQHQCGKNDADISIIGKYGERRQVGCMMTRQRSKVVVTRLKKWLKRHSSPCFQRRDKQVRFLIQRIEKLVDWMVVFDAKREVITIYHADKRR